MTRLPPALQPLWPVAKRAHRAATRATGGITRATGVGGDRAVPTLVSHTSAASEAAEPDHVHVHPVAPATHLQRDAPVGGPEVLRFWDEVTGYDVPERFVMDVQDGRLIGDYAATITPGGRLDLQTSAYFGIRSWREHPLYLRGRLPEPVPLPGTTLSLTSAGSARNYYHGLMDSLARWALFEDAMPEVRPDRVVIGHQTRWARDLVALAGIDEHLLVEPVKHLSLRAERLLVPSLPNPRNLAPPWITEWLRTHLRPSTAAGLPRRLYVTRGDVRNTRRLVHEAELLPHLDRLGFTRFDPGAVSVQDQIDHFAAAEVVVAPHGAGLVNLNFAPPGVRVLELFAPRYVDPGYWSIVSNVPDSTYRYLVADPVDLHRPEREMVHVQDDITLSPRAILDALEELLAA